MKKFLFGLLFSVVGANLAYGTTVEHKLWDAILKANVDANGYVDYAGIRINRGGDFYQHLTLLEDADIKSLSEEEKIAFWVNTYNAHILKFMLAKPKAQRANEDPAIYEKKFKVARLMLSLNDIKNRVLLANPAAPNLSVKTVNVEVLFALSDGSVGSPRLANRAYFAAGIEDRLQGNVLSFVNNPENIRIENGRLILSGFFQTHAKEFDRVGGLDVYLLSILDTVSREDAADIKTNFITLYPASTDYQYDWTINTISNKK